MREPRSMRHGADRDRGSMLVVTMFVGVAMTASVLVALSPVITGLVRHQRAQSAADAAALAGVVGGRSAAAELAAANGAVLVGWEERDDAVEVVVELAGSRGRARATDAP